MSTQISHVYNVNRNAIHPVNVICTPLNGRLQERMDTVGRGVHNRWKGMAFLHDRLDSLWKEGASQEVSPIADSNAQSEPEAASPSTTVKIEQKDVIYLTADSPNTLEKLEEGKSYVIGGIVDHNRYKVSQAPFVKLECALKHCDQNLCYEIAQEQGIGHAALPIGQYIEMSTRKVLTVNQCFEIMSKWYAACYISLQ